MNQIKVKVRKNYGKAVIYPVCEKAKTFVKMMNKLTLSIVDLQNIQQLDFNVVLDDGYSADENLPILDIHKFQEFLNNY